MRIRATGFLLFLFVPSIVAACPYCAQRPLYWAGVFNDDFLKILASVTWPILLLLVGGLLLLRVDSSSARKKSGYPVKLRRGPLLGAGAITGVGMGGYIDGIFLHMLLQWHHIISNWLPPTSFVPLEVNMFWDGIFSLGMWLMVALGLWLVWRASVTPDAAWSGKLLLGSCVLGWGAFNIGDSIAFHWIMRAHHIYEGSSYMLAWDVGFLISGLLLCAVGWWIIKNASNDQPRLKTS